MLIEFVEIQNFRKLKSVRIDFAAKTTLCVGANNSGKTSAMMALSLFLGKQGANQKFFRCDDFTLANWGTINRIGRAWETDEAMPDFGKSMEDEWRSLLPTLDVWIKASISEIHHVSHLLPTLSWNAEPIGVRLCYEPKELSALYKEYVAARKACNETLAAAQAKKQNGSYTVPLWPSTLHEFLDRRLRTHFVVRAYILNHRAVADPAHGVAAPQVLPAGSEPLEGNPFRGLIRVDEINAQRGFSDAGNDGGEDTGEGNPGRQRKLSEQLRGYWSKHIDPSELPDPDDVDALEGIHAAELGYNMKLQAGFSSAFEEIEGMGYPGVTDPRLKIATKLSPVDGIKHSAALQYEIMGEEGIPSPLSTRLPEQSSGLGYQNLVSIIFRLMAYRDSWMRVGKASKKAAMDAQEDQTIPPLHLVLIEEPEAHLHAQVQQVFIRKAYDVLRNHVQLKADGLLRTQLVVSTHSSHIVHECDFGSLRYFRRLPAASGSESPKSIVINLTTVFGSKDETQEFATRYLRATHCDLFFADAAILVEGPAERMLLPHFIREHFQQSQFGLYHRYLTILEIGGSHAHRLRSLIEHIGVPTLIVTDIDSGKIVPPVPPKTKSTCKVGPPVRGTGMVTKNSTIAQWVPGERDLDALLAKTGKHKIKTSADFGSVRVAYQVPISVSLAAGQTPEQVCSYTFEDALVCTNLELFRFMVAKRGLAKQIVRSINSATSVSDLAERLFKNLRNGEKAEFALDVISQLEPRALKIPMYIDEGLNWLQQELKRKEGQSPEPAATIEKAEV